MVGFIQATGSGNGGLAAGMKIADYVQNKKKEEDRLKGLASGFLKVRSGDDSGWDEMANADPNVAMNMWKSQQALDQKNLEKQFNTTNEIKNYNALIGMGVEPDKARDLAFKVKEQKDPFDVMYKREEAKQYVDDLNAVRTARSNFPQLEANVNRLRELSPDATFTEAGKLRDYVAKQFGVTTDGAKARAELESIVNNAVLPLLKQTFGAAFTAEEGLRLQKTLANPDATDQEKIAELDTFIKQKMADIETKERKLGSYNQNYSDYKQTNNVSEQPPTQEEILAELKRRGEI